MGPLAATAENIAELLTKSVKQRRLLKDKRKPVYSKFAQALAARAEASQIEPTLIKPLVERSLTKLETGYTWRADPRLRLASPIRLSEKQLAYTIANIQAPCLLIEGDKGYITEQTTFASRKAWFKKLTSFCFQGGHHVHLEQSELTAKTIEGFLVGLNKTASD